MAATSRPDQKAKVEMYYSSATASVWVRKEIQSARTLLYTKRVKYDEYDVLYDEEKIKEMRKKSRGVRRLPQIFINDKYIGGYHELQALEEEEKLSKLLLQEYVPKEEEEEDVSQEDEPKREDEDSLEDKEADKENGKSKENGVEADEEDVDKELDQEPKEEPSE